MKRHVIKPLNTPPAEDKKMDSAKIRQEIGEKINFIAQSVKNNPKKAAKIFEGWVNESEPVAKKRRAA